MSDEIKVLKLFDYIKGMTVNKDDLDFSDPNVSRNYSPYIIDKFISMINVYIPIVNEINKNYGVSKQMHYDYYKYMLPKRFVKINYTKKEKEDDNAIDCLAKYYEVSPREGKMYLGILTEAQVKEIVSKYDYGVKGK